MVTIVAFLRSWSWARLTHGLAFSSAWTIHELPKQCAQMLISRPVLEIFLGLTPRRRCGAAAQPGLEIFLGLTPWDPEADFGGLYVEV